MAIVAYLMKELPDMYDLKQFVHFFFKKLKMQSASMQKSYIQMWIVMGM